MNAQLAPSPSVPDAVSLAAGANADTRKLLVACQERDALRWDVNFDHLSEGHINGLPLNLARQTSSTSLCSLPAALVT